MTTAAAPPPLQDGSSLPSTADQAPPIAQSPHWPLRTDDSSSSLADETPHRGVAATTDNKEESRSKQLQDDPERALPLAGAGEADAQLSSSSSPGGGARGTKRPWWKTRWAIVGYAGAVLLVLFVVLLVLGLLGYLRKVGPLSSLASSSSKGSTSPSSTSAAPNPLTTIPLMSDPFALPPATPVPTSSTAIVQTAVPTQTIQPVRMNQTRFAEIAACGFAVFFVFARLDMTDIGTASLCTPFLTSPRYHLCT